MLLRRVAWILISCAVLCTSHEGFAGLPVSFPDRQGMRSEVSTAIDRLVEDAIAKKVFPSAAVAVVRNGFVVYRRSFNVPDDALFDLASLTKVVATAPAMMSLIERGHVSLADRLQEQLPEVHGAGTREITIESLLRHRSGYPADNAMADYLGSPAEIFGRLNRVGTIRPPFRKFLYSDVGFIQLARVVERVSGMSLAEYAKSAIFAPLGMRDTEFRPLVEGAPTSGRCTRCVPTSDRGEPGIVHDARARALKGVAGHAGVFSTIDDLAVFAEMILGCGKSENKSVLSRNTVREMARNPMELPSGERRGLGWDIDTPFSSPRGSGFPVGSFGHSGYTGTSLWIDPSSATAVILLTNRAYYESQKNGWGKIEDLKALRAGLATLVADSITGFPRPDSSAIAKFCAD